MSSLSSSRPSTVTLVAASCAASALAGFAAGWCWRAVRSYRDAAFVLGAADFAARKHTNQRRKDPDHTPYINHVVGVSHTLAAAGVGDPAVLAAALLHDTVEDTDTSVLELRAVFGDRVASIVDECSDDKTKPKAERKQAQIDHAPHASYEAKLVKLADKLYNLQDLNRVAPVGWSQERVSEYFEWAARVIEGVRGTNSSVEHQLDAVFAERKRFEAEARKADNAIHTDGTTI